MNFNLGEMIAGYFAGLAPRERALLGVLGIVAPLLLVYAFIWDPLQQRQEVLAREITRAERNLVEIERLRGSYLETLRRIEANQAAISQSDEKFNLFSYVQGTVQRAISADRISSMNPSTKEVNKDFVEERVEIKINQIPIDALVDLIYRIEKGTTPLRFSRLQVKKRKDETFTFDVTATVSLLKAATAAEAGES